MVGLHRKQKSWEYIAGIWMMHLETGNTFPQGNHNLSKFKGNDKESKSRKSKKQDPCSSKGWLKGDHGFLRYQGSFMIPHDSLTLHSCHNTGLLIPRPTTSIVCWLLSPCLFLHACLEMAYGCNQMPGFPLLCEIRPLTAVTAYWRCCKLYCHIFLHTIFIAHFKAIYPCACRFFSACFNHRTCKWLCNKSTHNNIHHPINSRGLRWLSKNWLIYKEGCATPAPQRAARP